VRASAQTGNWRERFLGGLAVFAVVRPWTVVGIAAGLVALSLALTIGHLQLKTSNLDLVDSDLGPVADFRGFARTFGTPNMLVIVLEGRDERSLQTAVERVVARVKPLPSVRNVLAKLPYDVAALERLMIDPYFTSRDGHLFFLFVQPNDPDSSAATIAPFVRGVRDALREARLEGLGIHAGLTGLPQYALDDRDIIQRDITSLSLVSYVLILGLFVLAFGALAQPLMAIAALSAAVVVTLGMVSVVPGYLTLVSTFFVATIFGLGIDYGIHVIDRTEEYLAAGYAKREAIPAAVRAIARGLATGALTTAAALFTLVFSGFRGFRELGLVAGTGILVSLVAMTTLLPALLVLLPERTQRRRPVSERRMGKVLVALQHPVLAALLGAASVAGLLLGPPPFDGNYLHLQPRGSEAARLERAMVERSPLSPQFAVFVTDSLEKARDLAGRLAGEDTVAAVRSIADLNALDLVARPIPGERAGFEGNFLSPDGHYAVYAYPKGDVWEPTFQEAFLARMMALDPHVTGMPVLGRFMIDRSKRALKITGILSALATLLIVFFDFREPRQTLLAIVPKFLGVASLLGLMRLFGIPFNPLNVMALPVVIGIGVDNGVHVVHRFATERGDVRRTLAGTGRSVLFSSLMPVAAFGAITFTAHRGLASFALALTLGVSAALALAVLVLPQLLVWAAPWLRMEPVTTATPAPAHVGHADAPSK
jgi:predicted RND superfamily exporter protein